MAEVSVIRSYSSDRARKSCRNYRFWSPVLCCFIFAVILACSPNFGQHNDSVGSPLAGDFLQEWIGGYAVRTAGPTALFDIEHVRAIQHDESLVGFEWSDSEYFAMVYPPFYYLLWVPASCLPYSVAAWLFVLVMIGCLLFAFHLMVRSVDVCFGLLEKSNASNRLINIFPWMLIAATIYMPLIRCITTGQKGTLCLLIFSATFYLYVRKKNFSSGLVFGLLIFKPQLAVVVGLGMVLQRNWAFLKGCLVTMAIGLVAMSLMGTDVLLNYLQFCMGAGDYVETSGYDLYKSHCLLGFLAMLGGGEATSLTKISWLISSSVIFGLLINMFHHLRQQPFGVRAPLEFSALIIATLLITPHLFTYDLVILLLPMFLLFVLLATGKITGQQKYRIQLLLIGLFVGSGISVYCAYTIGFQLSTIMMLGLLCLITQPLSQTHHVGVQSLNPRFANAHS